MEPNIARELFQARLHCEFPGTPSFGISVEDKHRRLSMSLILPDDIPVAAENRKALDRLGSLRVLESKAKALVLVTGDPSDPYIVWASPKLRNYRSIWAAAAKAGFVDPATEWGDNVDIDHVFPKSWATSPGNGL